MVTDVEYMQIVNEVYDLSDYNTKKEILFCNEAKKTDNLEHIVNRLYGHIKANTTGIDFGTIPRSKGVVTKVDSYTQVVDCINSIHDLISEYHEDTRLVDELSMALANIQKRERIFTKAFALNIEFPIMIYNMTVLSVISGTSLLISSSVEYIKNGHDSFVASFDKSGYTKSKDHVLYEYVRQFNRLCTSGDLDKTMNECVKNNIVSESVVGDLARTAIDGGLIAAGGKALAIASTTNVGRIAIVIVGAGMAIIGFINLMRKLIYFTLRMRTLVSDWCEIQAVYLQINAENLKYRDDPKGDDHKKQVYQKQTKWVERLRKLSNKLALQDSKAQKDANKDDDDYSKKKPYGGDDDDDGLF